MATETNITLKLHEEQYGEIKVHSQIINDLSSGIYSSPASCIKELINNSYDADATIVRIRMRPIEDSITIIDDGDGMNAIDFSENFAWISKSNKRNQGMFSKAGRPLIGKIGIGFIAVNEICDILEVTSTKKGENIKFTARINLKDYHDKPIEKRDSTGNVIGYIKGAYILANEEEVEKEHYTIIRLIGLKETVFRIFNDELYQTQIAHQKNKSFSKALFKNMKELLNFHYEKKIHSFQEDSQYIQFIIDLASYIPIEYIEDGPIPNSNNSVIEEIKKFHEKLNFKVDLDGIFLKKPIYFPEESEKKIAVKSFKKDIAVLNAGHLRFKGYFYTQDRLLIPRELNGVSIRIKNIPIAEKFGFDNSFMGYPNYTDQIFRNWVSGEIYIDEGLEDAMNIDRQSFRVTHPHYLALQDFVHKFLREEFFSKTVQEIYDLGSQERKRKKRRAKTESRKKVLKSSNIKIKVKERASKAKGQGPITIIKATKANTVIEIDKNFVSQFSKKDWDYLEDIFLIFETAFNEAKGDVQKLRELFYAKIEQWKAK